jgi:hypothetical protein
VDFQFVLGFTNLNGSSDPSDRRGVVAGVQRDIASDIDDAFMKPVNLRNADRQAVSDATVP